MPQQTHRYIHCKTHSKSQQDLPEINGSSNWPVAQLPESTVLLFISYDYSFVQNILVYLAKACGTQVDNLCSNIM
jgi:hypothetical protein